MSNLAAAAAAAAEAAATATVNPGVDSTRRCQSIATAGAFRPRNPSAAATSRRQSGSGVSRSVRRDEGRTPSGGGALPAPSLHARSVD